MEVPIETFKNHLIGSRLCKILYTKEDRNTMLCVRRNKKDAFVIINGTNRAGHWIHNLSLSLTSDGKHTGFETFSRNCYEELMIDFQEHIQNDKTCFEEIQNIYLISHSLGASALIIMLHDELMKLFPFSKDMLANVNIDIVLLGAPKSGNKHFVDQFNQLIKYHENMKLYRYSIQNDVVSLYPPLSSYTHVCDPIQLYDQKALMRVMYNHSVINYINNFKLLLMSKKNGTIKINNSVDSELLENGNG